MKMNKERDRKMTKKSKEKVETAPFTLYLRPASYTESSKPKDLIIIHSSKD